MQRTYQLPPAALHNPTEVSTFVRANLGPQETAHHITHQHVGVLACQHPQTLDRFLGDAVELREYSTAEASLFVIDDSWEDHAAKKIAATAEHHGVDYYRLRNTTGLAERIAQQYVDTLPNTTSDSARRQHLWLARAAVTDRLGVTINNEPDAVQRGGYGGARNFGYLAGIYRAGKAGQPLSETVITVNDDDMRYLTLGEQDGVPKFEKHDFFAERAAWYQDPHTRVVVERYAGHRGNPIAITYDAIAASERVIDAYLSGDIQQIFAVFNQKTETFEALTAKQAFNAMPRIVQSIIERRPQVALATHNSYSAQPTPNWEQAKINFGAITLRGDVAAHIPVPTAGIYDRNFGALLRGHAGRRPEPNRVIRVGQAMVHQRECRQSGGDSIGASLTGAVDNVHNKEQAIISHAVAYDERLREIIQSTFNIPSELFRLAASNQDNTSRIKAMQVLVQRLEEHVKQLQQKGHPQHVVQAVERLTHSLPIAELQNVQASLEYIPTPQEQQLARRGIIRYLRLFDAWPGISHAAYTLGQQDSNGH